MLAGAAAAAVIGFGSPSQDVSPVPVAQPPATFPAPTPVAAPIPIVPDLGASVRNAAPDTGVAVPVPAGRLPSIDDEPASAAVTMAHAREHGDDRAPPIDVPIDPSGSGVPQAWDSMNPESFRAFEAAREQRLLKDYAEAASARLAEWRRALDSATARGIETGKIAAAEEKIRRLEAAMASASAAERKGTGDSNPQRP
ncbi:hypothetical protein [Aquabacterium humicola]|uniref:hypothetical protein n=1 Tax=Aquabacterium humicola TaxID=3237377 RepID=UPI002542DC75|nr:hypothetical protein [Rubrivivax pictus]